MSNFISNAFQVPNAVIDDLMANLSPNALKCYLLIVRKTTGWGKTSDRISESQFMDKTGIKNVKTVRTAMVELSDLGLIDQNKKRGQITEYSLVLNSENQYQKTVVPKNGTSTKNYPKPVPKIGSKVVPKIGTLQKTITKTTNTKEKVNQKVSGISLESLPEQISKQTAKDFIDHRKALKKSLTQKAFELAMSSAIKCVGVTPDQAIDICIERGWQTPRPEWIANHLNSSRSNHQSNDIDFNSTGWGADLNVR